MLENLSKSRIQLGERSELRLHFEWTKVHYLSRGVLPETLRRGPYAVVDERCDETTLLYFLGLVSMSRIWLLFRP